MTRISRVLWYQYWGFEIWRNQGLNLKVSRFQFAVPKFLGIRVLKFIEKKVSGFMNFMFQGFRWVEGFQGFGVFKNQGLEILRLIFSKFQSFEASKFQFENNWCMKIEDEVSRFRGYEIKILKKPWIFGPHIYPKTPNPLDIETLRAKNFRDPQNHETKNLNTLKSETWFLETSKPGIPESWKTQKPQNFLWASKPWNLVILKLLNINS
jgi:hypothetical protein